MNDGTTLFFLALFTLLYLKTKPGASWFYPVAAGLVIGYAFNIRPQSAVSYGLPFAVWSVIQVAGRDGRKALPAQIAMLASFLLPFSFALYYNHVITGHALQLPNQLSRTLRGVIPYGFGSFSSEPFWHTPMKVLINFLVNLFRMNLWLFGWPHSLILVFAFIIQGRFEKADRIHCAVIVSTCAMLALNHSPGVLELGPRYYFVLLPALMLFGARGIVGSHRFFSSVLADSPVRGQACVPVFLGLSILFAGVTFYLEQGIHQRNLTEMIELPYRAVEDAEIHNAIVRVDTIPLTGWVFGIRNNNPDLSDDVIYVLHTEPEYFLELMDHLPKRETYKLRYNGETGRAVIEPLGREELEAEVEKKQASSPDDADGAPATGANDVEGSGAPSSPQ